MDARVAQNTLNFLLSERMTYKGPDTMALIEMIRELQVVIRDGSTENPPGGDTET